MNILTKALNKIGKKYEELSPIAKATYDRWEKVLSTKKIDTDILKKFLRGEVDALTRELVNREMTTSSSSIFNLRIVDVNSLIDRSLKDRIMVFGLIVDLLDSPEIAAKTLEANIERLLPRLKKVK